MPGVPVMRGMDVNVVLPVIPVENVEEQTEGRPTQHAADDQRIDSRAEPARPADDTGLGRIRMSQGWRRKDSFAGLIFVVQRRFNRG